MLDGALGFEVKLGGDGVEDGGGLDECIEAGEDVSLSRGSINGSRDAYLGD